MPLLLECCAEIILIMKTTVNTSVKVTLEDEQHLQLESSKFGKMFLQRKLQDLVFFSSKIILVIMVVTFMAQKTMNWIKSTLRIDISTTFMPTFVTKTSKSMVSSEKKKLSHFLMDSSFEYSYKRSLETREVLER